MAVCTVAQQADKILERFGAAFKKVSDKQNILSKIDREALMSHLQEQRNAVTGLSKGVNDSLKLLLTFTSNVKELPFSQNETVPIENILTFNSKTKGKEWLSNFYPLKEAITDSEGKKYYTVEAYFQAQKIKTIGKRTIYDNRFRKKDAKTGKLSVGTVLTPEKIAKLNKELSSQKTDGKRAREIGRIFGMSKTESEAWDKIKDMVMEEAITKKFEADSSLKEKLEKTGTDTLAEHEAWAKGKPHWGVKIDENTGVVDPEDLKNGNIVGKLLMKIRKPLSTGDVVQDLKNIAKKNASNTEEYNKEMIRLFTLGIHPGKDKEGNLKKEVHVAMSPYDKILYSVMANDYTAEGLGSYNNGSIHIANVEKALKTVNSYVSEADYAKAVKDEIYKRIASFKKALENTDRSEEDITNISTLLKNAEKALEVRLAGNGPKKQEAIAMLNNLKTSLADGTILLHEVSHGVFEDYIENNPNEQVVKDLYKLYENAKEWAKTDAGAEARKINGGYWIVGGIHEFVAEFINPITPYKGLLIFHKIGSGKTCSAIRIG